MQRVVGAFDVHCGRASSTRFSFRVQQGGGGVEAKPRERPFIPHLRPLHGSTVIPLNVQHLLRGCLAAPLLHLD